MYLAVNGRGARTRYSLRESVFEGDRLTHRELYDLGRDPAGVIVYPGGNSFYFDESLTRVLDRLGATWTDSDLERLFLPFLKPDIRRIVVQMTRLGRRKRVSLSREAMNRKQAELHLFDRRRLYYLRFGRMDSPAAVARSHRFLNVLLDKSRDEIENLFRNFEVELPARERKGYVWHALDLGRFFPGEIPRLYPQGIEQTRTDEVFLSELCRLNRDGLWRDTAVGGETEALCEYLVHYLVMWFDFEFVRVPPEHRLFEEFVHRRRQYRPPQRPAAGLGLSKACAVFSLSVEEWTRMSRDEVVRAYRRLALESHPDQGGDEDSFVRLTEAYERLLEGKG